MKKILYLIFGFIAIFGFINVNAASIEKTNIINTNENQCLMANFEWKNGQCIQHVIVPVEYDDMNINSEKECKNRNGLWVQDQVGIYYCGNPNNQYEVKVCTYNINNNETYGFKLELIYSKNSSSVIYPYIIKNGSRKQITDCKSRECVYNVGGTKINLSYPDKEHFLTQLSETSIATCPKIFYKYQEDSGIHETGGTTLIGVEGKTNIDGSLGESVAIDEVTKKYEESSSSTCLFTATHTLKNGKSFTFNGTVYYDDNGFKKFCIETAGEKCTSDSITSVEAKYTNDSTNAFQHYNFDFGNLVFSDFKNTNTTCPSNIKYVIDENLRAISFYSPSSDTSKLKLGLYNTIVGRHGDSGTTESYDASRDSNTSNIEDTPGTEVEGCEGLIGPNTLAFLKMVLNMIMIAGPMLAVVLGSYDLVVAMAKGEEEDKKKGIKRFKNRLIAAGLLLLLPAIVELLLNFFNHGGSNCL